MNERTIRYKDHLYRFLPLGTDGANGVLVDCTPMIRASCLGGYISVPASVATLWASALEIALESDGDIPDAARRIASYADGAARANVYAAAKLELARHGDQIRS